MECPHLAANENIAALEVKELKTKLENGISCSECKAPESIWLCTACGQLSCGRYIKGHGLQHYEMKQTHPVCMDTKELSVYCYSCDDYIVNDTPTEKLNQIRDVLVDFNSKSNNVDDDDSRDTKLFNGSSVNGDDNSNDSSSKSETGNGRRRSLSVDGSNGVENRPSAAKKARKEINQKQLRNLVGLRNLGNTCFMSAVLQSLGNIPEFCRVLKDLPSLEDFGRTAASSPAKSRETRTKNNGTGVNDGPIMTEELRKVLVALNQDLEADKKRPNSKNDCTRRVISPEALFLVIWKVVPRFRGYQQQDAHEFLRYMLDRLHTELLSLLPGDLTILRRQNVSPYSRRRSTTSSTSHTIVTSIFGGMLQSEVTCLTCKMSSKKHDPFLDLSIDIPSSFIQYRKSKDKESEDRKQCQLHDCLQKFVDIEELAETEHWICGNCKSKQRSTKKFWIRRLPRVLCLHIKRFRWSPYSRTKVDTHVSFPLTGLDMSNYLLSNLHETRCSIAGSSLYDLAAVIVHHGSGAGSGHYTAFVTKNNDWYHFNDSTVQAADPDTVAQSKAYILFYIQRAAS